MRRRAVGRGSPDLPGMSKSEDQLAEAVVTALGAEGDGIATVAGDGPAGGRIHGQFAAPGDRIVNHAVYQHTHLGLARSRVVAGVSFLSGS